MEKVFKYKLLFTLQMVNSINIHTKYTIKLIKLEKERNEIKIIKQLITHKLFCNDHRIIRKSYKNFFNRLYLRLQLHRLIFKTKQQSLIRGTSFSIFTRLHSSTNISKLGN